MGYSDHVHEGDAQYLTSRHVDEEGKDMRITHIKANTFPSSEHYTASLFVWWHCIQRARTIADQIEPSGELAPEFDLSGHIKDQAKIKRLGRTLTDNYWEPGNGIFFLDTSVEWSLSRQGEKTVWKETWMDPSALPLVRVEIVWEAGLPSTLKFESLIWGTDKCYSRTEARALAKETLSQRAWMGWIPLKGDHIYDHRRNHSYIFK